MTSRMKAGKLLEMCDAGILNPRDVLENVLFNYMSSDDADDFAKTEYEIEDEEEDEEDEE